MPYYDLGWYAAGANLSDIAAMGAKPAGIQMVVRYPKGATNEQFTEIMKGAQGCIEKLGMPVEILGGDTGGGVDHFVIVADANGLTSPGRILRQSKAKPRHDVYVKALAQQKSSLN